MIYLLDKNILKNYLEAKFIYITDRFPWTGQWFNHFAYVKEPAYVKVIFFFL